MQSLFIFICVLFVWKHSFHFLIFLSFSCFRPVSENAVAKLLSKASFKKDKNESLWQHSKDALKKPLLKRTCNREELKRPACRAFAGILCSNHHHFVFHLPLPTPTPLTLLIRHCRVSEPLTSVGHKPPDTRAERRTGQTENSIPPAPPFREWGYKYEIRMKKNHRRMRLIDTRILLSCVTTRVAHRNK